MPRILGTGLVALDLIVEHYDTHQTLLVGGGGTCGNVLAILARAGWHAQLIGALDHSVWSDILLSDLEHLGVRTEGFVREPDASPSLIVEHLKRSEGSAGQHWFSLVCPRCQSDWPGLRATPDAVVRRSTAAGIGQDIVFVDRLSDGVMELVHKAKSEGSRIVYEPSSKNDRPWVGDMLALADIVKYSSERADALGVSEAAITADLVIVTDGAQGVRWRLNGPTGYWRHRPATPASIIVDTCGAGDWFTAGLLLTLFEPSSHSEPHLIEQTVSEAINRASGLAAWSCGFVGARGALYDVPAAELTHRIRRAGASPGQVEERPQLRRPALPDADCHTLATICGH